MSKGDIDHHPRLELVKNEGKRNFFWGKNIILNTFQLVVMFSLDQRLHECDVIISPVFHTESTTGSGQFMSFLFDLE